MPPPDDLVERDLPLDAMDRGGHLYRIHPIGLDPAFFGPAPGREPIGRWDDPAGSFRICYLAEAGRIAFAETFLREVGRSLVPRGELERASLATFRVARTLRLVRFHGNGLTRLGATAAVAHGDHRKSRPWSPPLHENARVKSDGIRYRPRHDDDGFAIALFDRAHRSISLDGSTPVLAEKNRDRLVRWLDRYGTGIA